MRAAALGSAVRLVRSLLRLAGDAFLAHAVAGLSWPLALIFGAIALATGPTVVSPLVQRMRLPAFLSLVLARLIQPGAGEEPVTSASPVTLQLTLGTLFLLFSGCEVLLPEAGLPASVAAGVVDGLRLDGAASKLDALISQPAQLAITVLFPLLAADVAWSELSPLGLGGLICVLGLMPFRLVLVQLAGRLGLSEDAFLLEPVVTAEV
jgi:NhaP-type Na+/H+ or K+/H+ antiporter